MSYVSWANQQNIQWAIRGRIGISSSLDCSPEVEGSWQTAATMETYWCCYVISHCSLRRLCYEIGVQVYQSIMVMPEASIYNSQAKVLIHFYYCCLGSFQNSRVAHGRQQAPSLSVSVCFHYTDCRTETTLDSSRFIILFLFYPVLGQIRKFT